jgi:hypothetical protein
MLFNLPCSIPISVCFIFGYRAVAAMFHLFDYSRCNDITYLLTYSVDLVRVLDKDTKHLRVCTNSVQEKLLICRHANGSTPRVRYRHQICRPNYCLNSFIHLNGHNNRCRSKKRLSCSNREHINSKQQHSIPQLSVRYCCCLWIALVIFRSRISPVGLNFGR